MFDGAGNGACLLAALPGPVGFARHSLAPAFGKRVTSRFPLGIPLSRPSVLECAFHSSVLLYLSFIYRRNLSK